MRHLFLATMLACDPEMGPAPDHCATVEPVYIQTEDGAEVSLHHHASPGPPVLLIHGISSNHRFWDLTPEHSFPRILGEAGFDPWLMDLRGHGSAVYTEAGTRQRYGWSIDDYGRYDVPAAIAHIQEQTGHPRVAVVGHSMGGMVAAIYASIHGDDDLAALVTVGSPVAFPDGDFHSWMGKTVSRIAQTTRSVATPSIARFMAGWHTLPLHGEAILFTASNLPLHTRRLMLRHIVSPTSRGEFKQIQQMLQAGRLVSADGQTDHTAGLSKVDAPVLAIGGGGDFIVPPERVAPWSEVTGSEDVTVIMASESNGFVADYGHLDLALGPAAPREILQPIATWLNERRDRW
jgi:pimeloyl-ACP methyl ester carboxylesterase